jgi:hypothetical protein
LRSKSSHLGHRVEFLCTDLDGNLSSSLNPLTASKLDYYLSRLLEGLSGTANKGKIFDQHMLNTKSKHQIINEVVDIALFATWIPLSLFTNLFHQRFEKHSMLESTLEILQHFYIQMETQLDDFHLFARGLSAYTLMCIRCGQSVTLPGLIGETLLHAPTAMLYHWNMIQSHDEENHRELMLIPLLFISYEIYLQSSKSFEEGLTWSEDLTIFQKRTKYGQVIFCEAVELDMINSN